ncbi:hypothetical protein PHMEG_00019625 [Phytophthora megakarya]|uniref:Uncharacterized protein n=1 Tax=Phytophthora megakarya TaxID=4795 RepID=A0A225VRF5_9STRA|nr:hypothetical protein PHMEG_00019625 [Phytophthora megakarya]
MYLEPHIMFYHLMNCPSEHSSDGNSKTYIREMTAHGIKTSRIRNAMPRKFGVGMDSLPSLSKVQNYAYHYKITNLLNHDKHNDVVKCDRNLMREATSAARSRDRDGPGNRNPLQTQISSLLPKI